MPQCPNQAEQKRVAGATARYRDRDPGLVIGTGSPVWAGSSRADLLTAPLFFWNYIHGICILLVVFLAYILRLL